MWVFLAIVFFGFFCFVFLFPPHGSKQKKQSHKTQPNVTPTPAMEAPLPHSSQCLLSFPNTFYLERPQKESMENSELTTSSFRTVSAGYRSYWRRRSFLLYYTNPRMHWSTNPPTFNQGMVSKIS